MDPYEAQLLDDIQLRRAELMNRAESLRRAFVETFDPRERVKRNPLSGLLTSLGAGMFLGRMMPGRSTRGNGTTIAPEPPPAESTLASIAVSMLPGLLPTLMPLMGPLMSLLIPKKRPKPPKPPGTTHS